MLSNFGMEIEFSNWDIYAPRKFLRKLDQFPVDIWDKIDFEIKRAANARARKITRFGVSKSTVRWRKWFIKKNIGVETYSGVKVLPLNSPRVGRRTGTFINDFRESREPGVTVRIGKGEESVINGSYSYQINYGRFAKEYPLTYFSPYLIDRGIIPEGGFLDFGSAFDAFAIDHLHKVISVKIGRDWDQSWGP